MKHRILFRLFCTTLCLPFIFHGQGLMDNFGLESDIVKNEKNFSCVPKAEKAPPSQHSSAEGLPPLPLPVVPLRRTEKKNPPRPPVLIGKIATKHRSDWATNPADAKNLLRWMAKELKVHFSSINIPEKRIPSDPKETPVLYRTGHDAFSFSDDARMRLRKYLLGGGTLILDACCGRRDFVDSALREIQELIPERPPYRLTMDHPVYHSFFDIKNKQITYRTWAQKAGAKNGIPSLIGIDVGCRTAVFFFRWDVSCGWDDLSESSDHHCLGYNIETAKMLGANLMAYITAERSAALPLSKALDFVDADDTVSGKFRIAQAKYSGIWKTRDAGLSMLLNSFHDQTKTPVRFEQKAIPLDSRKLFETPFLYMTGHQDFTLTPSEKANLREYLMNGGVLFAEACCGREAFHRSFMREIESVLNGKSLEKLPQAHMIYMYPNRVQTIQPRPALAAKLKTAGKVSPDLYGININGALAVIYSPYGLSCGWELADCPYCIGPTAADALSLGVNILSYSIMN